MVLSGSRPACLPLPFICSPNSLLLGVLYALKNGRLGAGWSGRVPGRLVSNFFICLPVLFICFPGWVLACLRLPFIVFPLLFNCLAGCLWSGSRLACLPLPFICPPLLFICLPLLFIVSQGRCLWSGSRPACLPLPFICLPLLFICLPGWVLVVGFPAGLSPTSFVVGFPAASFHLSAGVRPFPLAMYHFYSFQCPPFSAGHAAFLHCWCPPLSVGHAAFLFMCLPGLSLVVSALFRWPCSISILLSPRSVTGVSLSIGHEAFVFICLPGPSLLVPCSISIHLSFRTVTGDVRPCPLAMKHFYSFVPLAMQHFYSFVSRVCHWCCRPFPLAM